MYCIADWDVNFEVDSDGRRWKTGKNFFAGPLPYVRCPARRDWPVRLLHIERQLGDQVYMVLGMFEKLASIVATEPRTLREGGVIRNSRQEPASLSDIALMLLVSEERAKWAMEILCSPAVEWVVLQDESGLPDRSKESSEKQQDSQNSASVADKSEIRGNTQNLRKSASVKVISDQKNTKSCHSTSTVKGPRILPLHDESAKKRHDPRPDTRCFVVLNQLLRPPNEDSYTSLANFVKWLATDANQQRAGPKRYSEAIKLAADCVNGKIPMAVFMSRVKKQWGYQPPSRKRKYR